MRGRRLTVERIVRAVDRRLRRLIEGPNRHAFRPRWEYQRRLVEPRLTPQSSVLDVGSGHDPCPRASVLADFFPDDMAHRAGALVEDRPVVVCSVERLPFQAGAFDFALCAHVLEHVESPTRAARELARVARSGLVETPSYGSDVLVGTGHQHRWQVVAFEGQLFFFEYEARQREAHVSSPVMDLWLDPAHHPWQDFFWDRMDLFNALLSWDGAPRLIEHRRSGSEAAPLPEWRAVPPERLPATPPALTPAEISFLEPRLATPEGARPMRFRATGFASDDGEVVYPVRGKRVYCEMGPATTASD